MYRILIAEDDPLISSAVEKQLKEVERAKRNFYKT